MRRLASSISVICASGILLALQSPVAAGVVACIPDPAGISAATVSGTGDSCAGDGEASRLAVRDGIWRAQSAGRDRCQNLMRRRSGTAVCASQDLTFQAGGSDRIVALPGPLAVQRVGDNRLGICSVTNIASSPSSGASGQFCGHLPFEWPKSRATGLFREDCGFVCHW